MTDTCPLTAYASLHGHSHFSLMDAICTPEEMVLAAKEKGLRSIALTDHGVMHGVAQMYMAGKKHGVRVHYGMEAYCIGSLKTWQEAKEKAESAKKGKKKTAVEAVDADQILDEDEGDAELDAEELGVDKKALKKKGHLVILAKSQKGLSDLFRLSYLAHRDGFYSKPRTDKDMLAAHAGEIVATTACMGGIVSNKCWELKRGEIEWADVVREAQEYEEVLGKGNFFLEMQFNREPGQQYINDCMMKIHLETGIPLTVTTDSHYIKPEDWEVQDVLYMMRSKPVRTFQTRGEHWHGPVPGLYIKDHNEMWQSYLDYAGTIPPEIARAAFENTLRIDESIVDYEPDTRVRLPSLPNHSRSW
jgi:DNA polymerase III subunit alpha